MPAVDLRMHITNIWHPGLRIIEFGATSGRLAEALVGAGYRHFLSVVHKRQTLDKLAAAHPRLQSRLAVAPSRRTVRQNNAEVLILRGRRDCTWPAFARCAMPNMSRFP